MKRYLDKKIIRLSYCMFKFLCMHVCLYVCMSDTWVVLGTVLHFDMTKHPMLNQLMSSHDILYYTYLTLMSES